MPGQTGVIEFNKNVNSKIESEEEKRLKEKQEEEYSKQFDLFYRPLPSDHQLNTLMQVSNSIEKNNEEKKSEERVDKNLIELKAHECPKSLAKGE